MKQDLPALLRRASAGDRAASDELFGSQERWLYGRVRRLMGPRLRSQLDSGDVVQQVLLNTWRTLISSGFECRNERELRGYLDQVVTHTVRKYLTGMHSGKRDVRRQARNDDAVDLGRDNRRPSQVTPSHDASTNELAVLAQDRVAEMTAVERELLHRRLGLDQTWSEIGAALGITDRGAKKRFDTLVARLRRADP